MPAHVTTTTMLKSLMLDEIGTCRELEKSFAPESAHLKYPTSRAAMAHLLPGRSDATPRLPATAEAAATLHPTPIHGRQQDRVAGEIC